MVTKQRWNLFTAQKSLRANEKKEAKYNNMVTYDRYCQHTSELPVTAHLKVKTAPQHGTTTQQITKIII
jgi:hypothetical protein